MPESTRESDLIFYITRDGGRTWQPTAPVESQYASIPLYSFIGADTGFSTPAIGLLRTSDGGRSWTAVNPKANVALLRKAADQLDFVNPTTGWIVRTIQGAHQLLRTTDGGQTWSPVYIFP